MRRALSYAPLMGVAVGLITGCPQDPPSFLNLGTESATEGLTEGDLDTTTGDAESTGMGSSTAAEESSTGIADESSTGAESSSDDNSGGALCGDGVISGNEECDCGEGPCTPEGLGDKTCVDASNPLVGGPLTGGVLGCNPASCKFNVDLCTWCGDGEVNGGENCEPEMEITETCLSLGEGAVGDLFCGDACQIDTAGCTECGAEFEFDECLDPPWFVQLTHGNGAAPSWACGLVSGNVTDAPPANGETVWATGLDDTYRASESSAIISPQVDLTNCGDGEEVQMRITHWYEFEGGIVNADGGVVQVSNDGFSWTTVEPIDGAMYNEDQVLTTAWNPPDNANGFSGNSVDAASWTVSSFDVSSFAGSDVLQVRFVFGSDSGSQRAGWYIDRVEFVGNGGA